MSICECSAELRGFTLASIQVDEAHERSIYTDLLLGILKKLLS